MGAWLNLTRYRRDLASLTGLEPNARSIKKARQRVQQLGWEVDMRQGNVEAQPFPKLRDGRGDVCLVFGGRWSGGTALDQTRPQGGGALHLLERVRSRSRRAARVQDIMAPLWRRLAGNCHPNRDTELAIGAVGIVSLWPKRL